MIIISVYWYDESIIAKLREITGDSRISVKATDTLFRFVASLKDDQVKLPLIALTRRNYSLDQTGRSPSTAMGYPIGIKSSNRRMDEIQFIPIHINYQLDIITRRRDDNDTLTDEIIWYFINHPTLKVNIGKGANVDHNFNLFFNQEVEDNSDLESHISRGEYFRSTLTAYVPDARLWKMTKKFALHIDPVEVIGTTDFNDSSKDYMKEIIHLSIDDDSNESGG